MKMKKIIISITIVIFVLAGIALVVMYNLGDRIIEEAIKGNLLSIDTAAAEKTPEDSVENNGTKPVQNENAGTADENSAGNNPDATAPAPGGKEGQAAAPDKGGNAGKPASGEKPADNKPKPADTKPKPAEETELTPERINQIKNEVSAADKISAAALALKRLSASDIKELTDMLNHGLSKADREKAKALAYARFTPDEIEKIKEMYEKYMK
jgi:hypothetical protein